MKLRADSTLCSRVMHSGWPHKGAPPASVVYPILGSSCEDSSARQRGWLVLDRCDPATQERFMAIRTIVQDLVNSGAAQSFRYQLPS